MAWYLEVRTRESFEIPKKISLRHTVDLFKFLGIIKIILLWLVFAPLRAKKDKFYAKNRGFFFFKSRNSFSLSLRTITKDVKKCAEMTKKFSARTLFILTSWLALACAFFWLQLRDNEITLRFPRWEQRNHCRRFRKNRQKIKLLRALSHEQETQTSFKHSTMQYPTINLRRVAVSPIRTFHAFSPGSWMFPQLIADCISYLDSTSSPLVPVEMKATHKSEKSVCVKTVYNANNINNFIYIYYQGIWL